MLANAPKTRVVIYLIGIASQIASFFVAIYAPDVAQAFSQTADVLGAIALGTAITNIPSDKVYTGEGFGSEVTPKHEAVVEDADIA